MPSIIRDTYNYVGNPIENILYSYDCLFASFNTSINIIYIKILFSLLIPVGFYLALIGFVYAYFKYENRYNFKTQYFLSIAIYVLF